MNRFVFAAAILLALSLYSCQDTKESAEKPLSAKDTYRTVGEQIPFETGMKWIEFYKQRESEQGRLDLLSSYNVPAERVNAMLESTSSLVGVAFHFAIDDNGKKHILVIPVDESLSLWSVIPGRIFLDANSGEEISQQLASAWATNYKNEHPDDNWFHFFGKDIFDEIKAVPFFETLDIAPAINILNLKPQLLLIVMNNSLLSLGRTSDDPGLVYDASNPCPPCQVE